MNLLEKREAKGRAEGKQEGLYEGLQKGKQEGLIEVTLAIEPLAKGEAVDAVCQKTNLSVDYILNLKNILSNKYC